MVDYSQSSTWYLVRRLLKDYIVPYKVTLWVAIICMIIVAVTTAVQAKLIEPVLDEIFINKELSLLVYVSLLVFGVSVLKGIASYGQLLTMKFIGQRVLADMQLQLYKHVLSLDIASLHAQGTGKLISRFTNDIMLMRRSISTVLTGIVKDFIMLIGLVGLMFYQNWGLAVMAFTVFPVAIYPIVRLGKRMRKISGQTQEELGNYTAKLDETFQGIKLIQAYARESYEYDKAETIIERLFGLYMKAARTESLSSPIMETLGGVAIAGVVAYGGYQVIEGYTTAGAFFSFITALMLAYRPLKGLSSFNTSLQEGLAAARRFFHMIDTVSCIQNADKAKPLIVSGGGVLLENVVFSYSDNVAALKGVTLDIPAGKTVALVGRSGSGKSTIMHLLLRFYDVDSGTITIDGQSIEGVTLESLREHVAVVSQDITLFDDTVYQNILYGNLHATKEQVMEAARLAAADEFIVQLPEGYDTQVGQHGFKLSGGQRQRIAIARAILKNAPILLLDEATSSLDSVSEQHIHAALDHLMQGRTTLVIAHRLSTIKNADIIYVMDAGVIVDSGSHQSLLDSSPHYKELYTQQLALEKGDE